MSGLLQNLLGARTDWSLRGHNRRPTRITVERGGIENLYRFSPPIDPEHDAELLAKLVRVPGVTRVRPIRLADAAESALLVGYESGKKLQEFERLLRAAVRNITGRDAVIAS